MRKYDKKIKITMAIEQIKQREDKTWNLVAYALIPNDGMTWPDRLEDKRIGTGWSMRRRVPVSYNPSHKMIDGKKSTRLLQP